MILVLPQNTRKVKKFGFFFLDFFTFHGYYGVRDRAVPCFCCNASGTKAYLVNFGRCLFFSCGYIILTPCKPEKPIKIWEFQEFLGRVFSRATYPLIRAKPFIVSTQKEQVRLYTFVKLLSKPHLPHGTTPTEKSNAPPSIDRLPPQIHPGPSILCLP